MNTWRGEGTRNNCNINAKKWLQNEIANCNYEMQIPTRVVELQLQMNCFAHSKMWSDGIKRCQMLLHRFAKRNRRCKLQKIYEKKKTFQIRVKECNFKIVAKRNSKVGLWNALAGADCKATLQKGRKMHLHIDELHLQWGNGNVHLQGWIAKKMQKQINCMRKLQLILQTKKNCGRKYNFIAHLKFIQIISKSRSIAITNYENESQCKNLRRWINVFEHNTCIWRETLQNSIENVTCKGLP